MSNPKKLPSGKWSTQLLLPDGSRPRITTNTKAENKGQVRRFRADVDAGDWFNPNGSKMRVADVWEQFRTRNRADSTEDRHDSLWANHVRPKWGGYQLGAIFPPAIYEWVNHLREVDYSASHINLCIDVLSRVYKLAIDQRMFRHNPTNEVKRASRQLLSRYRTLVHPPTMPLDEERAIILAGHTFYPDKLSAAPFLACLRDTAGRWSEVAALRKKDVTLEYSAGFLTGQVHIVGQLTRTGNWVPILKGGAKPRSTVLMADTAALLAPRLEEIEDEDLVFTSPKGNPLHYSNWKRSIYNRVHDAARLCNGQLTTCDVREPERHPNDNRSPRVAYCQISDHGISSRVVPHDWRRTTLTQLGEGRMPRHELEAYAGHKPGSRATAAYLVARPEHLDRVYSIRQQQLHKIAR